MSLFEFIRFSILVLGWPFLIIGSIFIFAKQIKFNKKLNQPSFGKLIFAVILGWFATMYSLGITATIFMFQNLNAGVKTVLPIFLIWIITMLILISIIKKWNKEVLITQKFYNQLTDGVKNIINGSLSYRIKTSELNGEAEKNSEAFNEMIKELEKKEDWIVETAKREKEINIMKSEFISIAAHQLRTPLSAIKWIFSILLDEDAGKINQEQKELLERGGISTKRMIELVNDLLDVSRIEEGRFDYSFKKQSLSEFLEKFIKNFLVETSNKEIKFTFNNRGKELFADFDAEKLLIAIQNLMENAVNYTPPKGKISVALFAETKNAIIEIKDTGIGIPGGELHKLFKKFFRASNAMLLQTEGSGLGLFIAKNIIEKHKGKIVIESEEGRGVTAKIFIPIA